MPRYFDAHNHLQDHRLDVQRDSICAALPGMGLTRAVVAGSGEDDWPEVAALTQRYAWIIPSFGVHPWYVKDQSGEWQTRLEACLRVHPQAGVGEIGLDRWVDGADVDLQQRFFAAQMQIAKRDNRAATIHCLRAWGMLEQMLRAGPRPKRGFLLHSYGGPAEMVDSLARMGAYFSVSPYFLHERKTRQWQTFRDIPLHRLLIETDAPDMWPPDPINPRPLRDFDGGAINHPANIDMMYEAVSRLRGVPVDELAGQVEANFVRLFGLA